MADPDPFQRWLDDYRSGVDEALARAQPPSSAVARDAQDAFQNWWRAEHEELLPSRVASRLADPALSPAEEDRLLPPDWPAQVERLACEKADAERRLSAAQAANEALARRVAELEKSSAEAQALASRERERLEARLAGLEEKLSGAAERERALREGKSLRDESATRFSRELEQLEEALALEREKGVLAARQGAVLARQVEDLERERARLRETAAAQEGALQELRSLATGYQTRLIEAKELTDADIALMRQDLKLFLEELKIIRNTLKKGE